MYKKVKVLVEEEVLCCDGCYKEIHGEREGATLRFPSVAWAYGKGTQFELCSDCFDMVLELVRDALDQVRNDGPTPTLASAGTRP